MRALTLIQPMGWAIAYGHKPYENRVRDMRPRDMRGVRERVAIHSGAKWDDGYAQMVYHLTGVVPPDVPMAVVGVATFTGRIFTLTDPPPAALVGREWFTGPVAFEIASGESIALRTPVRCRGALGFWPLPPAIEAAVMEQL